MKITFKGTIMPKYIAEYKDKTSGETIQFSLHDDDIFQADKRAQKRADMNNWQYVSITSAK
jgi:hypothetical protein